MTEQERIAALERRIAKLEEQAAAATTAHEVKLTLDGKVVGQQIVGEINRLSAIRRRGV